MGKGKRAHTISTPSIPSFGLPTTSDISFSVSPIRLKPLSKSQAQTSPCQETPSAPLPSPRYHDQEQPTRRYEDIQHKMESAPLSILVCTYLNYFVIILLGHLRDICGKIFKPNEYCHLRTTQGFAPLVSDFDSFFTRRLYMRIRDCWNRPVTGVASRTIHILERKTTDYNKTFQLTGQISEKLNFASYNYLGFSSNMGPCTEAVERQTKYAGITWPSTRAEAGTTQLHNQLEKLVARFVGKEDAMVVSMGFATNSATIPALVGRGCLIISDELNHSSIVFGARLSGANVRVFRHNDTKDLHDLLREMISQGQPRTHLPWKKILIIVEGLYSMEGTVVNLPELVRLKRKYKCYLYVDEAHSIGALGDGGGGVCDYYGIHPKHVDILMGTFTKSFGAAGGYIAANKEVIDHLRTSNHAYIYAEPMPVPIIQQIMISLNILCGLDGTQEGQKRLQQLARNSLYFSSKLRELGFTVYGDHGSPVVPLLLFNPAKIPAFSRELLKQGIAICVVGYPATSIISSRARFCLSASHTKHDLDRVLSIINKLGDLLMLKYNQ